MSPPLLDMRGIGKRYTMGESSFQALKGVDLAIEENEYVAIVGPSGSGKSTLMNILGCLDAPDAGQYLLRGRDVAHLDETALAIERNRSIGFVFQSFHLLPALTAEENIALPMELNDGVDPARIDEVLDLVGLAPRRRHYPRQLSGGEQQRVAIARAFVTRPRILFADEPTGNLDQATGRQISDLLFRLNQDHGTTLVLVTHDMGLARRCQRVFLLDGGRLVEDAA